MINEILTKINDLAWGVPMLVLIMGAGLLLTVRLGGMQFKKLGLALKLMVRNEEDGDGEVTSFGALCTAMAATVGTGNIVGVAGAVLVGGPGALFWMFVAACLGMATKYAEGLLAVNYRTIDENGVALGGPFLYIEKGMGTQWKWLAKIFAVFGVGAGLLGIGTMTQVNGIATAVENYFDPQKANICFSIGETGYTYATVITAVVVTVFVALIVIGGIQRIAAVTTIIVPFMAILYVVVCVIILALNVSEIPGAIVEIFRGAFGLDAAAGGMLGALFVAMQKGVARGVFSNEAGLGSAPIAAAAAMTKEPVRQGLVTMTGTFIDTIIICMMTGLTVLVTDAHVVAAQQGFEGASITAYAFGVGGPWGQSVGAFILMICLAFFAVTTILGWDYYSERCLAYLTGGNMTVQKTFKWLYVAAVFAGPFLTVSVVWTIAEIFNGFMAIPNLIALIALSGVVAAETKSFFEKAKEDPRLTR